MKLDFSALAQPAAKTRGQVGTTGTPAFTRVCASPLAQPGAGTAGDKPAPVVLAPALVMATPATRPPVSPACPQGEAGEKINDGAVSPASPLVPVEMTQAAATPLVPAELYGRRRATTSINTCTACLHLLRHGTCGEPVAAGLVPEFGIVWPPDGHAAGCAAFSGRAPAVKQDRPYRLAMEQADRCHTPCWDDAEIARFEARQARFIRKGMADQDADDLAEVLTLRDRDGDDRRICRECRELSQSGRCSAAARGDMPDVGRHLEPVPNILMRCTSFEPAVSAHRNNPGAEDASHHD